MMKPMAAFQHLAVANVTSIDFCSGSSVANADNEFWSDRPIELMIHPSYGDSGDVTTQMILFRTRYALKANVFASLDSLGRDLCKILPI